MRRLLDFITMLAVAAFLCALAYAARASEARRAMAVHAGFAVVIEMTVDADCRPATVVRLADGARLGGCWDVAPDSVLVAVGVGDEEVSFSIPRHLFKPAHTT